MKKFISILAFSIALPGLMLAIDCLNQLNQTMQGHLIAHYATELVCNSMESPSDQQCRDGNDANFEANSNAAYAAHGACCGSEGNTGCP